MRANEVMTRDVRVASPDQSIRDVGRIMVELDVGALPVAENDRLVGMVTDRDIVVRAVAQGKSPDTKVQDVMSREVKYAFEDEDVEHVARNMGDIQVRRLPVVSRDKRLVGIISLADVATKQGPDAAGKAVSGISERGGAAVRKAAAPR